MNPKVVYMSILGFVGVGILLFATWAFMKAFSLLAGF